MAALARRASVSLACGRAHLAKRGSGLSAQAIEDGFEAERLFGNDADRGFTPSRWY